LTHTVELKGLLRTAQAEFRALNRNRNLTTADRKQLKSFYLQHVLAPRARKVLQGMYPAALSSPIMSNADITAEHRFLTAKELESWLKIDAKTLYHYANQKLIPHVRVKTSIRFPADKIRKWLESHSVTPSLIRKPHRGTRTQQKKK